MPSHATALRRYLTAQRLDSPLGATEAQQTPAASPIKRRAGAEHLCLCCPLCCPLHLPCASLPLHRRFSAICTCCSPPAYARVECPAVGCSTCSSSSTRLPVCEAVAVYVKGRYEARAASKGIRTCQHPAHAPRPPRTYNYQQVQARVSEGRSEAGTRGIQTRVRAPGAGQATST